MELISDTDQTNFCCSYDNINQLESYEQNLKGHPYRFNGIYGAAKAAEKLNDIRLAVYYFDQLVKLSADTNSSRPEISEAKEFLATNSISIANNV